MGYLAEIQRFRDRGRAVLGAAELELLSSPATLASRLLRYPFERALGHEPRAPDDLDSYDPNIVAWLADAARVLGRYYFRLKLIGVERVPSTGAALFVGNHNGGLMPLEGLFTLLALHDTSPQRPVHALAHDVLFHDPVIRRLVHRAGILRAGHTGAEQAFSRGRGVLVYPGSDLDSFRPFVDRHRIELGGRKGFVRLALRNRVPIVPVVSTGTHEQFIVLSRGDFVSRYFNVRRFLRTGVLPITLSIPWGLSHGLVPYLPLPAQTTVAFGDPLGPWDYPPSAEYDPQIVNHVYEMVREAMQRQMDELARGRRFLFGRRQDRS